MYEVLKYNNEKKQKYKMFYIFDFIFKFIFIVLLILSLYKNKFFILLGLWFLIYLYLCLKLLKLFKKDLNFNVFVLNEANNEFYKIGIYPNSVGFLANDEEFLKDQHFLYEFYSTTSALFGYHNDNTWCSNSNILKALIKLNDDKYILKQINNINFADKCCKIIKIYSYEYIENLNSYSITCDVIMTNNKKEYKKTILYINRKFDKNNIIKKYLENVCIK